VGAGAANLGGWFGDFCSTVWGGVKRVASAVDDTIRTVSTVVKAVATGTIGPKTVTVASKGWSWNYDGNGGPQQDPIDIGDGVLCNGCYSFASVGLYVSIDVENYGRDQLSVAAWVEGDAGFAVGSGQSGASGSTSSDKVIDTVQVPTFDIQVGPLPVVITITVPVHVGYTFSASFEAAINVGLSASGSVKYGLQYTKSGGFVPIAEQSYTHTGALSNLQPGTELEASLTIYVLPVAVIEIEYIGGPNFGLKGFMEFAMSAGSQAACDPHALRHLDELVEEKDGEGSISLAESYHSYAPSGSYDPAPSPSPSPSGYSYDPGPSPGPSPSPSPSPPAFGVQATANIGLQATVGGSLNIHVGSVTVYKSTYPSKAIYAMKWPVATGCLTSSHSEAASAGYSGGKLSNLSQTRGDGADRADSDSRMFVPFATEEETHTHTWLQPMPAIGSSSMAAAKVKASTIALQNGGNVPGTVWHGSITRLKTSGECSKYPAVQKLSLQLTSIPYYGSLLFVGANNYAAYNADYTAGEACVVQSGFTGNWYASGSLAIFPDQTDSDYSACSYGAPAQPYGFSGTFSAGWKTISAQDSLQCLQFSLSRVSPTLV